MTTPVADNPKNVHRQNGSGVLIAIRATAPAQTRIAHSRPCSMNFRIRRLTFSSLPSFFLPQVDLGNARGRCRSQHPPRASNGHIPIVRVLRAQRLTSAPLLTRKPATTLPATLL